MIFDRVGGPSSNAVLFWQRLPLWSTSYEDSVGAWRLDGYGEEAERLGEFGKTLFSDMLTLCPDHRPSASALLDYSFFNEEVMADGRSICHEGKDALQDASEGGRTIHYDGERALEGGTPGRYDSASQWGHLQGVVEKDGFAVKPGGCEAFKAHLDLGRQGGVQCVVALSPGAFLVWPRSHKSGLAQQLGKTGFHTLTKGELAALPERSSTLPAKAGDVLLMQGGTLVHGSPDVPEGSAARVVAYANFDPEQA